MWRDWHISAARLADRSTRMAGTHGSLGSKDTSVGCHFTCPVHLFHWTDWDLNR
jgi:hypothetical protein